MASQKDDAVVLRRLDYSETSQVLAFFGRESGQVRLIAKGIKRGTKKAFAVGIDLLEMGTIVFLRPEGRSGLGTLTEWRQTDAFLGLRNDVRRLYAGQYAAEITSALTEEGDPHPELFDALVALLRSLASGALSNDEKTWRHGDTETQGVAASPRPRVPASSEGGPGGEEKRKPSPCLSPSEGEGGGPLPFVVRFQMQLLTSVGLVPIFDGCAACQRQRPSRELEYFSAGQGGMICRDCEPAIVEKRRVAPGVADSLTHGELSSALTPAAFDVLNYTVSYAMNRPSRLAPYLLRLK